MFAAKNAMLGSSGPAVAYGATGPGGSGASTAISYTHTPAAADNCVVAGISSYSYSAVPGNPTYGGTTFGSPLIALNVASEDLWMYVWALKITAGQGAKTVAFTNNSGYNCANTLSYSGVGSIGTANSTSQSSNAISIGTGANPGGVAVLIGAVFSTSSTQTWTSPVNSRWVKNGVSGVNEGGLMGDVLSPVNSYDYGYSSSGSGGLGLGYVQLLPV